MIKGNMVVKISCLLLILIMIFTIESRMVNNTLADPEQLDSASTVSSLESSGGDGSYDGAASTDAAGPDVEQNVPNTGVDALPVTEEAEVIEGSGENAEVAMPDEPAEIAIATPVVNESQKSAGLAAASGNISGFLWVDGNGMKKTDWNGKYDGAEYPLAGFTVYLYLTSDLSTPLDMTTTDGDGAYTFKGLGADSYTLGLRSAFAAGQEYLPPMKATDENMFVMDTKSWLESYTAAIPLTEGQAVQGINAGMRLPMGAVPLISRTISDLPNANKNDSVTIDGYTWVVVKTDTTTTAGEKYVYLLMVGKFYGNTAFGTTTNYDSSNVRTHMKAILDGKYLPTIQGIAVKPTLGAHDNKRTLTQPTANMAGSTTQDILFAPSNGDMWEWINGDTTSTNTNIPSNHALHNFSFPQRFFCRTSQDTANVTGVNLLTGSLDWGILANSGTTTFEEVPGVWVKASAVKRTVKVNHVDTNGNLISSISPNPVVYNVTAGSTFTLTTGHITNPIPSGYVYKGWKKGSGGTSTDGSAYPSPTLSISEVFAGTELFLIYKSTTITIERYLVYKDTDMTTLLYSEHWLPEAVNKCGTNGAYTIIATEDDMDMIDTSLTDPYGRIASGYKNKAVVIPSNKEITLKSDISGTHTIKMQYNKERHFDVQGKLTLENITLDGGQVGGGLNVAKTLNMNAGSTVQNCRAINLNSNAGSGGGVYVTSSGTLTMNNGSTISGNLAQNSDSKVGCGGGVYVEGGTLTMNGGTISGNTGNIGTNDGDGGGVFIKGGTMTMENGSLIDGNFASTGNVNTSGTTNYACGGAMYLTSGTVDATFTMNGGTISNNYAGYNSHGTGGGVYVVGSSSHSATFKMKNGTISGNIASRIKYGSAGGVRVGNYGVFIMEGGTVSNNKAAIDASATYGNGGGVNIAGSGSVTIKGLAEICDNIASVNSYGRGGGIHIDAVTNTVSLEGSASIHNNIASTAGSQPGLGGGVFMDKSTLNMIGSASINNNTAATASNQASNGGGIYVLNTGGASSFTMSGSASISGNTANAVGPGNGGGVYLDGNTSTLTMTGGSVTGNKAPTGDGGGIYTTDHAINIDPAGVAKYSNIGIANSNVSGNLSVFKYEPPSDASVFTNRVTKPFNGLLLDNDNISYRNPKVNILISKTVTGLYGDRQKDFTFTVTFKNESGNAPAANTTFSYDGGVISGSGATKHADGTLTLTGGVDTFVLKHGQTILLKKVPYNYQIKIVETPGNEYNPTFTDSLGASGAGDTGFRTVTSARTFQFTNVLKVEPVPSGISDNDKGLVALPISTASLLIFILWLSMVIRGKLRASRLQAEK